jgi:hypothetical protein
MLIRRIVTVVALLLIVQPVAAALYAAECETGGSARAKRLAAEHCANAEAQPPGSSDHASTEKRTKSSQDGRYCDMAGAAVQSAFAFA